MAKVYIGYQNNVPVRVETSRDVIESDIFLRCDHIKEYEGRAELLGGEILFDDAIDDYHAKAQLAASKAERAEAVAAITVEVDGMIFDGDEKAQERMARAVNMADSLDEETEWVLHDSTVAIVTAAQLRRACRAAGKTQTELWVKPYTNVVANTEQHYTLE
jgi:hypothetical protein